MGLFDKKSPPEPAVTVNTTPAPLDTQASTFSNGTGWPTQSGAPDLQKLLDEYQKKTLLQPSVKIITTPNTGPGLGGYNPAPSLPPYSPTYGPLTGTGKFQPATKNETRFLPRFKESTHCSKCLCKGIKLQFCDGKNTSLLTYSPADGNCNFQAAYKEHLHITCERCGYRWLMWAADVEAEDEKPSREPGGEL